MARRILVSFGSKAIRQLSVCSENSANLSRQRLLTRCTTQILPISVNCRCYHVSPVVSSGLQAAIESKDFEAVFKLKDYSRDIVARGFPHETTEQDVHNFFSETKYEDIQMVEGHPKLWYVRFKDASAKQAAMSLHKKYVGERYIELLEDFDKALVRTICSARSTTVKLMNLPQGTDIKEIKTFMEGLGVTAEDVVYLRKNVCVVTLASNKEVETVVKYSRQQSIRGKPVDILWRLDNKHMQLLKSYD